MHDESTLDELPSDSQHSSGHDDLYIVLECDRPLSGSTRHCVDDIDEIAFRRGRERRPTREVVSGIRRLTLEVPDSRMSSLHATVRRLDGHWLLEDADSRNGSYLQGRRVGSGLLGDGAMFEFGHTHFLLRSRDLPKRLVQGPPDVLSTLVPHPALGTLNHEREALFARMVEAARAGVPILLVGEAGSGKDTLAHAVHAVAAGDGAFVAVQCMLFGGGRGSDHSDDVVAELTRDFERAAGGTLFLNEIDGLGPVAQMALLPLLKSPYRARVARILTSVRSDEARPQVPRIPADLLAELAGFTMPVPPLRDRREDLGTLVSEMLGRASAPGRPSITMDPAMGQALLLHDWPYNVSELDSCLRGAVASSARGFMRWSPPSLVYARVPITRTAESEDQTSLPRLDLSVEHSSTQPPSGPDEEFAQNVRRALKCNLSVHGLQKNGLLGSDGVLEATKGSFAATSTVPALRDIVLSALESLGKSSPRGAKQRRVLQLTFIEPTGTQQEAADLLAMAFGTYRRYVTSALAELTSILWFNELSARLRREHVAVNRQDATSSEPGLVRSG